MTEPRTATGRALLDSEKLLVLAEWFDHFDDWREATGKIAPGIADYREVQADLRRIAAELAGGLDAAGGEFCSLDDCLCECHIRTDPA